jgi:hypothetical protein
MHKNYKEGDLDEVEKMLEKLIKFIENKYLDP